MNLRKPGFEIEGTRYRNRFADATNTLPCSDIACLAEAGGRKVRAVVSGTPLKTPPKTTDHTMTATIDISSTGAARSELRVRGECMVVRV